MPRGPNPRPRFALPEVRDWYHDTPKRELYAMLEAKLLEEGDERSLVSRLHELQYRVRQSGVADERSAA